MAGFIVQAEIVLFFNLAYCIGFFHRVYFLVKCRNKNYMVEDIQLERIRMPQRKAGVRDIHTNTTPYHQGNKLGLKCPFIIILIVGYSIFRHCQISKKHSIHIHKHILIILTYTERNDAPRLWYSKTRKSLFL